MKIDGGLNPGSTFEISEIATSAQQIEQGGYNGLWSVETKHDPFMPLLIAAQHTDHINIGTSVAIAFARSPLTLATNANDLHRYSKGRFILGLGSQIKPHITKRYSMPWSHPAARMREFVLALNAIWSSWNNETRLNFQGDFYTHTLMTPAFSPSPNPFGQPKVCVAAVGKLMTECAGEVSDGIMCHRFTTARYLREVTIPRLDVGRARAGRPALANSPQEGPNAFDVVTPVFIVTGHDAESQEESARVARKQIAFYASTPAYLPVLEHHGWADIHQELNTMSKAGLWSEMGDLITDEILSEFAVIGKPADLGSLLLERYDGLATRIRLNDPLHHDDAAWAGLQNAVKARG